MVCVDWKTGSVRRTEPSIGFGSLMAAVAVIVLNDEGELMIATASPEKFAPSAKANLDGDTEQVPRVGEWPARRSGTGVWCAWIWVWRETMNRRRFLAAAPITLAQRLRVLGRSGKTYRTA